MVQPRSVITLDYSSPATPGPRWRRTVRTLLALGAIVALGALVLLTTVAVRTVVFTGPVLFVIGSVLLVFSIHGRQFWPAVVGAAHCAVCVLFVGLVNLLDWTPSDAAKPFTAMGLLYVLAILPLSVFAFRDAS